MELKLFCFSALKRSITRLGLCSAIAAQCMAVDIVSAQETENGFDLHLVAIEEIPHVFPRGSDEPGLVVRYVDELMSRAGLSYDLNVLPAKRATLQAVSVPDTCVFPIARSQEREVELSWVSPISVSRHGFFAHPKKPLQNIRVLSDVEGLRIGSYLGSAMGEYLRSLGFIVDEAARNKANLVKLNAGRIDLWASDSISASYIASQAGQDIGPPKLTFFTTLRAIGCNKSVSDERIGRLNKVLTEMYQDDSITKIKERFAQQINIDIE